MFLFAQNSVDPESNRDCPWLCSFDVCFYLQTTEDMGSALDWPYLCLSKTKL